jgi:hypothetical protein
MNPQLYRFTLLKGGRGIAVFLHVEEVINLEISEQDIKVCERIYLRVMGITNLKKEVIVYWIGRGILEFSELIYPVIKDRSVCYVKNR